LIIDIVDNKPIVKREILKYRPKNRGGSPKHFLDFSQGLGKVIASNNQYQEQKLVSPDILALNGLGQLQQFEVAFDFAISLKIGIFLISKSTKPEKVWTPRQN